MHKIFNLLMTGFLAFGFSAMSFAEGLPVIRDSQETYRDIEKTFGFVPEFMKAFPRTGIAGVWLEMKSIPLNPNTALSAKNKELIGLAVAAQIPCDYCVYFHTKAAKANGATTLEISEAVAAASLARHWGTWVTGIQTDENLFRQEVTQVISFMKSKMDRGELTPYKPENIVDVASTQQDIKNVFGMIPTFLKSWPGDGVVGAWRGIREFEMNPQTALSGKVKDLIGLAVSGQAACGYCLYFHSQVLTKLHGASEREMNEAVAIASLTRLWSTVLNGAQINQSRFRSEVDKITKGHN